MLEALVETAQKLIISRPDLPISFEPANAFGVRLATSVHPQSFATSDDLQPETEELVDDQVPDNVSSFFDGNARSSLAEAQECPANPKLLVNAAIAQLNARRFEEAEGLFRKALVIDANVILGYVGLAKLLTLTNRFSEAIATYSDLLKRTPNDSQALVNLAQLYVRTGRDEEAMEALNRAIKTNPEDAVAYNNRATLRLKRQDLRTAISDFRKALALNERQPNVHNNVGVCFVLLGSTRKAEKSFRTALRLDPAYASAYKNLAQLKLGEGDAEGACTLLRLCIEKHPNDWQVRMELARAYHLTGRYREAVRELSSAWQKAEEQNASARDRSGILNNLGAAYSLANDNRKALEWFERALQLDPHHKIVLHNLAGLLFEDHRDNDARRILQRCLDQDANDSHALSLLGSWYCRRQEYDLALRNAETALGIDPKEVAAYGLLTIVLGEIQNNFAECARRLEIGRTLRPSDRLILNNLAYSYLMINRTTDARTILDGLDETRDDMCLTATRGLLLLREGNEEEAGRLYNLAARRAKNFHSRKLVIQKRDLEFARQALRNGDEQRAKRLLQSAAKIRVPSEDYFRYQAAQLLEHIAGNFPVHHG